MPVWKWDICRPARDARVQLGKFLGLQKYLPELKQALMLAMVINGRVTFRFTPKNQAITRNDIVTRIHAVQPLESVKMFNHPEQMHTAFRSPANLHHGSHPNGTVRDLKPGLPTLCPSNQQSLLPFSPGKTSGTHSVNSSFEVVDATQIMGLAWPLNKGDLLFTTIRDNKQHPQFNRDLQRGIRSKTSEVTVLNDISCTDAFTCNLALVKFKHTRMAQITAEPNVLNSIHPYNATNNSKTSSKK